MKIKMIVLAAVFGSVLGWFIIQANAQSAKPVELAFAYQLPPVHFMHKRVIEPWAKEVEERCGGKIKINLYPAESLVKAKDTYESVVKGVADIGWGLHHLNPGRFPLTEVMHLPFMATSMDTFGAAFKQLEAKQYLKGEYKGVRILWLSGAPPSQLLTSKKGVRTLEDMKGMIINTDSAIVPTIKAFGASPTQVPPPELYTSLQLGVIEGTTSPTAGILMYRLHEVAKYMTMANVSSITTYLVMNINTWNSLPPDVRKTIDELSGIDVYNRRWGKIQYEEEAAAQNTLKKAGVEFIQLQPAEWERWKKLARPSYDKWSEAVAAKGLPGKEVLAEVTRILDSSGK
jgi:TRAP-type transport system periplasmic protein